MNKILTMTEFSDEIKVLKTAFAEILKEIVANKEKRIEELCEEIGRLKLQIDISNEKMTRFLKGEE